LCQLNVFILNKLKWVVFTLIHYDLFIKRVIVTCFVKQVVLRLLDLTLLIKVNCIHMYPYCWPTTRTRILTSIYKYYIMHVYPTIKNIQLFLYSPTHRRPFALHVKNLKLFK